MTDLADLLLDEDDEDIKKLINSVQLDKLVADESKFMIIFLFNT